MKNNNEQNKLFSNPIGNEARKKLQGYPIYPEGEDIFKKYHEERDIDPEETSKTKIKVKVGSENDFSNNILGSDLDIPKSDLYVDEEIEGNEDEENDYYRLGGDDHNNLDETNE